jgi:uncharacterized protein (TIGR03435 family)
LENEEIRMRTALCTVLSIAIAASPALHAQTSANPSPVFDVAAIRQTLTVRGRPRIISSPFDGNFTATNATLKLILEYAYGLPQTQVIGGPDWLNSNRFDIQAKTSGSVSDHLHNLPYDKGKLQKQQMLRTLLADRFKLEAHQETRELPVFALVVAKNGPKLDKADEGPPIVRGWEGHLTVEGGDNTLATFAAELSKRVHRIVLDQTGIKGRYSIDLDWSEDNDIDDDSPSLFTAIREQLGLRLQSQKALVPVLIIDHIEMPSAN